MLDNTSGKQSSTAGDPATRWQAAIGIDPVIPGRSRFTGLWSDTGWVRCSLRVAHCAAISEQGSNSVCKELRIGGLNP